MIILIYVIALIIFSIYSSPNSKAQKICNTANCVAEASVFLSTMNQSVDPCNDFYGYVCGFSKKYMIDIPGIPNLSTSELMMLSFKRQIYSLLRESSLIKKLQTSSIQKMHTFFWSCMNTLLSQNRIDIINNLVTSLGGWTILELPTFKPSTWLAEKAEAAANSLGVFPFIKSQLLLNPFNSSARVFYISSPKELTNFSLKGNKLKNFTLNMIKVLDNAKFDNVSSKLMKIEIMWEKLKNESKRIYQTIKQKRRLFTASELQSKVNAIDFNFLSWLSLVLGYKVRGDEKIFISKRSMSYLIAFSYFTKHNKETMANYIALTTLQSVLRAPKYLYNYFTYNSVEGPKRFDYKPKWMDCIDITLDFLNPPIAALYLKKYYNKTTKENVMKIVDMIKKTFVQVIKSSNHFNHGTKKIAIKKMNNIVNLIGFPTYLFNTTVMDDIYKLFSVNETDFFGNMINARKILQNLKVNYFRKPVKRTEKLELLNLFETQAIFRNLYVTLVILPGFMRSPAFDNRFKLIHNLGSLGFVISHELSHAYFPPRKADGTSGVWWEGKEDGHHIKNIKKCLLDKFNRYTVGGKHMNLNEFVINEIFADTSGIQILYETFKALSRSDSMKSTGKLPGLQLTQDQLFFVSNMRHACKKSRLKANLNAKHPPSDMRILARLSNTKAFAKAFNCPPNSNYNPSKRCVIW